MNTKKNFFFTSEEDIKKLTDNETSKHKKFLIKNNKLEVVPAGKGMGWFSDSRGSLLFEECSGNFMLETEVEIFRLDGKSGLPKAQFSSAGLLIRDKLEEKGKATWAMYNIGFQNQFWGREFKITRPTKGFRLEPTYFMGLHSLSTLFMIPSENSTQKVKLRLARVNGEIRAYHLDCKNKWIEERPIKNMEIMGNGIKYPINGIDETNFRPKNFGLADSVQVGIITNPGMKTSKAAQNCSLKISRSCIISCFEFGMTINLLMRASVANS